MSELEEQVEKIFATVEELREVAGDGPSTRKLLESLFRNVHSLKARASASHLTNLGLVAHEFENLLHSLRTGKTNLDDDTLRLLNETSDSLFDSLAIDKPQDHKLPGKTIPDEIWNSLKDEERHSLKQSVAEGASLFLVQTNFDVTDFDRQFQTLKEELVKKGEVISTAPKVDSEHPEKINFRILYARVAEAEEISLALSAIPGVEVEEIVLPSPSLSPVTEQSASVKVDSVRINLEDLDRIISSTHKLFRQATALQSASETSAPDRVENIERSFLELSAELVNLRMVPVDRLLERGLRAGRAAAFTTGKEVDFVIRGRDLLLDKSLYEAIADPLVHLVRNAVAHGIEEADERSKLGKPLRGKIVIEAATLQAQTKIRVTDDGRGIDPTVVTIAARRLGILDKNSAVNSDQCVRLLFRAGFSTAPEVSGVSGRGVGLDVVETAVEGVGGSVRVSSQVGKGSEFEIRLPVTFGLLDVIPITVAERRYLIDASYVRSSEGFAQQQVETIELRALLGQAVTPNKNNKKLLNCEFGDGGSKSRCALLVDEIGETQQTLIRGLGSHSGRWFGVAGATELRDGTVVLLLDLPRLVSRTRRSR